MPPGAPKEGPTANGDDDDEDEDGDTGEASTSTEAEATAADDDDDEEEEELSIERRWNNAAPNIVPADEDDAALLAVVAALLADLDRPCC